MSEKESDVGLSRRAKQIFWNYQIRVPDYFLWVIRLSGFVILIFLMYLGLIGFLDINNNIIQIILISYACYVVFLEFSRLIFTKYYDEFYFRTVRVLINLIFVSMLILNTPNARHILVNLYLIPIFSTIVYTRKSIFPFMLVVIGSIIGFLISSVSVFAEPREQYLHAGFMILPVLIISTYFKFFYIKKKDPPPRLISHAHKISDTLDLTELTSQILQESALISGTNLILIIIVHPTTGEYLNHGIKGFRIRDGYTIEDVAEKCHVIKTGERFVTDDIKRSFKDRSIYTNLFMDEPRSVLAEPIVNKDGNLMGIINIGHNKPNQFDEHIERLMRQYAYFIGNSIFNSIKFREINLQLAKLQSSSKKLLLANDEYDVISVMMEIALVQVAANSCVIHKYDNNSGKLVPTAFMEENGKNIPLNQPAQSPDIHSNRMEKGEGIAGRSVLKRESYLVQDICDHPWFWGDPAERKFRSIIVAPIIDPLTNEVIGTISVNANMPDSLSQKDEFALVSLSTEGASAISKFRQYDRWQHHDSILFRIFNSTRKFDVSQPLEHFCKQIADLAIETLGFKSCRIRMLDADESAYITVADAPNVSPSDLKIGHEIPRHIVEQLLIEDFLEGRSYLIKAENKHLHGIIDQYFYCDPEFKENEGWSKYDGLITPILSPENDDVIGILTLDKPLNGIYPSPETLEAIGSFVGVAEWAIELCKTHADLVENQTNTKDFIKSLSNLYSETTRCDFDTIGRMVVQIGAELLSAEGCSLHLVERNNLKLMYSTHLEGTRFIGRAKPVSNKPGSGLSAWVAATGQPIIINDGEHQEHPAWAGETEHLLHISSQKSESVLLIPIWDNEKSLVIGVLTLENKLRYGKVESFTKEDIEKLKLLGDQIGNILKMAEQYKTIQEWERKGLQDDLHELINLYHSGVVLQLENVIDWLRQDEHKKPTEAIPHIYKRAKTTLEELKSIHTAVYSHYLERKRVQNALIILIETWKNRHYERDLNISIECPKNLFLPENIRGAIMRIISGAFSNAIRHSGILKDPNIEINVKVTQNDKIITFEVIDNGKGKLNFNEGYGIKRMRDLVFQLQEETMTNATLEFSVPISGRGINAKLVVHLEDNR